jgi:hypothetical protein
MISFFQLLKGGLNYFRPKFFWQGDGDKGSIDWLAKWSVICRLKDQCVLGIQDIEIINRALLGKWLFKLLTEDAIWQTLLRRKYGSYVLSQVSWTPRDSHFCTNLMACFFPYGDFSSRDGSEIRFSGDKWLGNAALQE